MYNLFKTTYLLAFLSCATLLMVSCDDDNNVTPIEEPVTGETINLTTNSLVQIVLLDAKDNQTANVQSSYVSLFDETVERNGGTFLGAFDVHFVGEGTFTPQQFRFYQWENAADAQAFQADNNQAELSSTANNLLRSVNIGYGVPVADVTYQFRSDRIYEVFSADLVDFDILSGFFPVQEFAAENFGRNEFLSLQGSAEVQGNWVFQIGGLVEWPDDETFFEFVNTTTFLEGVEQFRDPALDNLVLINGDYQSKE